jgi:glycosyltransferase involved in cell wall biosynthesis
MPLTVMEAMSVACPVVVSRAGDLPLVVLHGETGFVVDVGSVQGLADAIETLARDPALRARLGAAGRQRLIEHYSPAAMLRQLEGFCATLAEEDRARAR